MNPYAVLRPSRLAQQTEAGVMQGAAGRTGATEWANAVFRAHRQDQTTRPSRGVT